MGDRFYAIMFQHLVEEAFLFFTFSFITKNRINTTAVRNYDVVATLVSYN
jgi:hypothetical protein